MNSANLLKYLLLLILLTPLANHAAELALPELGDSSATALTPEQEKQIGDEVVRRMRHAGYIISDPLITDYIERLGTSLAVNAQSDQAFTFFVVDAPSINAFALPGGYIGIHTGLILASQSESELASVLAHEIAHVTQHHLARGVEQANRMQAPLTLALIAAILIGGSDPEIANAAIAASLGGSQQMQLNFTRAHEHEADRVGMQLLANSNFDPHGMAEFFSRLQDASRYHGEGVPEFLRTHPVTSSRLAEAQSAAEQFPRIMRSDSNRYHVSKAKLRLHHTKDIAELEKAVRNDLATQDRQLTAPSRYLLALIHTRQHRTDQAIQQLHELIKNEPNSIAYRKTLGDLFIEEGKYQQASLILEDSLKRFPDNEMLTLSLCKSFIALHRYSEGRERLQNLLRHNPKSLNAFFLLSELESKSDNQAASHIALAEYYKLSHELHSALEQLKLAKKIKNLDFYHASRVEALHKEITEQLETKGEQIKR